MAVKDAPRTLHERDDQHIRHLCRCEYRGQRCQFLWVVSTRTDGGPGLCNRHADLQDADPDHALKYARIVMDSQRVAA